MDFKVNDRVKLYWEDGSTNKGTVKLIRDNGKELTIKFPVDEGIWEWFDYELGKDNYWYEVNNSQKPIRIVKIAK